MTAFRKYSQGIKRAATEGKLVWLLWFINVLFASFVYFSFSGYLSDVLSLSAASQNFLKTFDMNTFNELIAHHGEGLNPLISFTLFLLIGYIFASVFINGGILFTLNRPKNKDKKRRYLPQFFEGGGKFFGRFFRLLVYSLLLWLGIFVVGLILHQILGLFTANSTNEALIFYLVLVRVAVALVLVFFIKMIVDYARIKIVTEDSHQVFRSLFQASGFVFRKLTTTLAIYYLFALTAAVIIALYWLVQKAVKTHSLLPILVAFFIGQAFIFSRGWIKVGLQSAQMNFYQLSTPPPKGIDAGSLNDKNPEEQTP